MSSNVRGIQVHEDESTEHESSTATAFESTTSNSNTTSDTQMPEIRTTQPAIAEQVPSPNSNVDQNTTEISNE